MARAAWVVAAALAAPFLVGLAAASSGPRGEVAFTFADPEIIESSGLVARDGIVLTVNDSGDTGRVFAVDPKSGRTVGVTTWSTDPTDVEALAPAGPGEVWVGDIGDNAGARDSVTVVRVPVGRGDLDVDPDDLERYELTYPGGAADAETLLTDPRGRLLVVTKGIFGGVVLRAPARLDADRPNRLRRIGVAGGIATDGAFFPDGRHFVVRDYANAVLYSYPDVDEVARWRLPDQPQGEGIAVDERGTVLISTEGSRSDVLRVRVPAKVQRLLAAPSDVDPSPVGDGSAEIAPEQGKSDSSPWPWLIGGVAGAAIVVVLVRSLRPR
ncbi:MAG: hypothetical protein WB767_11610 [Nocardioides sp.]